MSEGKILRVPESLFTLLGQDLGNALKPFDVRLLMTLMPDLLRAKDPVRINLSHLAVRMGRPLPQISRSMTSLVKNGYLTRHERSKVSYTYSLAAHIVGDLSESGETVRAAMAIPRSDIYGYTVAELAK